MIYLVTGLPGSGKTLWAIQRGLEWRESGREVFELGINGLRHEVTGFKPWTAGVDHWRQLPSGAVLIVDEAQQYLRRDVIGDRVPEWLEALTRNRHHGVDLLLITQDARFLHPMVRRLVNRHEDVVRRFGLQKVVIYAWDQCNDDTSRTSWRKKATVKPWRYPERLFHLYKSANQHTVERRMPARLVLAAVALALCALGGLFGWRKLSAFADKPEVGKVEKVDVAAKPQPKVAPGSGERKRGQPPVLSVGEWVEHWVPRVPGLPYSAPVFDGMRPPAPADLYCMATEARCVCHTDQGTRYHVEDSVCRTYATDGFYNPFRRLHGPAERSGESGGSPVDPSRDVATAPDVPRSDVGPSSGGASQVPAPSSAWVLTQPRR